MTQNSSARYPPKSKEHSFGLSPIDLFPKTGGLKGFHALGCRFPKRRGQTRAGFLQGPRGANQNTVSFSGNSHLPLGNVRFLTRKKPSRQAPRQRSIQATTAHRNGLVVILTHQGLRRELEDVVVDHLLVLSEAFGDSGVEAC